MSGILRRNGLAKSRRPSRHRTLNSLGRGGDRGLRVRPAQRRLESCQVVAQPHKREGARGATDLVRLGGEVSVRLRFAADRLQQVGDPARQRIGEFQGSGRADSGSDLLQAVGAQLRGHCTILSGSEASRAL